MNWTLAGAVILSGLVIVFLALIILIAVVNLTGRLAGVQPKNQAAPASSKPPVAPQPARAPASATVPASAPVAQAGIPQEIVAVISASIAAVMEEQEPGTAYEITGIQRAHSARPLWGFAGMQQNTRPF